MSKSATLMAAVSIALLLGSSGLGCGGSSEAEPLKKSQFVQQANAVCRNAAQERGKVMREAAAESREPQPAEFVTEVALPPVQKMTEELESLGSPPGDAVQVRAIISAFERGVSRIESDPTDLTAAVKAFTKANALALAYGLTDCTI